ncbi:MULTISPECIES: glycosyltransferase family 2 protein [Marinobacter]|uniref:Glycosyltransferase family 2 protein n=1 Tax=Marinobacter albus TaxID=3030833 RepID=A0ABT7HE32_9GAMM|nr:MULTISPECIES: glycosyltransferase family 2 protein [Marinobacter]MBW0148370.1 glycosyltransferase family 2 protein [Marinobacter arenosus]MBW7472038.1 glycosyltransferase family 2 protein [Marinobacter sp. F4218]MDK9558608.1 glycosyltransferase family 2 protein [Marinobacter sp. M216]
MSREKSLSLVIPARDEEENIASLVTEIFAVMRDYPNFEVVLVDDGSADQTLEAAIRTARLMNGHLVGVRHDRSVGQSTALATGVRQARGHLIATMDGDGQNDPSDIPTLLQKTSAITVPDFCIAGYRKNRKDTAWKRFQSRLANRVRNAFLHDGVPDTGCGLKLFPKATFMKLPWFDHGHRFIPALVKGLGGEVAVVEVNHRPRGGGTSKYTAWNRAWAGILDLFGVMWLLHRTRTPVIADIVESESRAPVAKAS